MCCVFVWNIKGESLYESGTDIDFFFFFLVSNDQNIGLILTKSYKKKTAFYVDLLVLAADVFTMSCYGKSCKMIIQIFLWWFMKKKKKNRL